MEFFRDTDFTPLRNPGVTWIALEGAGTLLLADGATRAFMAGEVARFADGEVHGFENTSDAPFVYLSVTSPPINFDDGYAQKASILGASTAQSPRK